MTDQPNSTNSTTDSKPPLTQFIEHQVTAAQETVEALRALVPPDFRTHSRAARREFLLSFKVLLDGAMSSVERELNKARQSDPPKPPTTPPTAGAGGASTTGKNKVKVEVS